MARPLSHLARLALFPLLFACSSANEPSSDNPSVANIPPQGSTPDPDAPATGASDPESAGVGGETPSAGDPQVSGEPELQLTPPANVAVEEGCSDIAKKILLFANDKRIWTFDPSVDGLDAYQKLGAVKCPTTSSPQSMAVQRDGTAWLFYTSGELFKLNTVTFDCQPTTFKFPNTTATSFAIASGFTAASAGRSEETLFVGARSVGQGTVDLTTYDFTLLRPPPLLTGELTGGVDSKLFMFRAEGGSPTLYALDKSNQLMPEEFHKFSTLTESISSYAVARYKGKFYAFSAGTATRTTVYDPQTQEESTRDLNIGFVVVGAGQSTCVPPPPQLY